MSDPLKVDCTGGDHWRGAGIGRGSGNTTYITITDAGWDLEDGTYILTDSSDGLIGPVVSGGGISLNAQGRNYKAGGETEYLPLADMSIPAFPGSQYGL